MPTIAGLSRRYDIPQEDVAELVDSALTQFEIQVSDFLRGDRPPGVNTVQDLDDLIIANALDRALPRDVDRSVGREMLQEVVAPRLERVEEGGGPDPEEVVRQLAEENFPLNFRDEIERRMERSLVEQQVRRLRRAGFEDVTTTTTDLERSDRTRTIIDFGMPNEAPQRLRDRRVSSAIVLFDGEVNSAEIRPPSPPGEIEREAVRDLMRRVLEETGLTDEFRTRLARSQGQWDLHFELRRRGIDELDEAVTAAIQLKDGFFEVVEDWNPM